jgi:hypothetical protein
MWLTEPYVTAPQMPIPQTHILEFRLTKRKVSGLGRIAPSIPLRPLDQESHLVTK